MTIFERELGACPQLGVIIQSNCRTMAARPCRVKNQFQYANARCHKLQLSLRFRNRPTMGFDMIFRNSARLRTRERARDVLCNSSINECAGVSRRVILFQILYRRFWNFSPRLFRRTRALMRECVLRPALGNVRSVGFPGVKIVNNVFISGYEKFGNFCFGKRLLLPPPVTSLLVEIWDILSS